MSILIVQVVSQGMIFGADRNVTETSIDLTSGGKLLKVVYGQSQRPKVLRWPNNKALLGYAGVAEIARRFSDEWFYDFIGKNIWFNSLEELANMLNDEVEDQRRIDEGNQPAQGLMIHLGGFVERENYLVPEVWFIRNAYALVDGQYRDIRKEYLCSEVFWEPEYVGDATAENIREKLTKAQSWFHQGFDLRTFNVIDDFLNAGFRYLAKNHPGHEAPRTLDEFERRVRMSILTYGAYFEAFMRPGEQYVGGGVDTVKLAWPI